ncbi:MAG: hypothetical protein AABZ19_07475 [Pseudomonadota bacterium]
MPAQLREHALGVQQRGSRVAVQDAKQRSFYAESLFCDVAAFTSERDVVAAVVGMGDDRANAWITAQDFKIRNGEPARVGVVVVDSERTVAVLGCKTYRLRKSYSISGISSRVGENSADAHVVNANKLLARFPPFAKYPGFCVFPPKDGQGAAFKAGRSRERPRGEAAQLERGGMPARDLAQAADLSRWR